MLITFTVVKFKGIYLPFGIFSMAIFRILFVFNKYKTQFRKLMGTGKNGTFSIYPDWSQWTYLFTWEKLEDFENFKKNSLHFKYLQKFSNQNFTLFLNPIKSVGTWDKVNPFSADPSNQKKEYQGKIGVLTRASIRPEKALSFWKNVPPVSQNLKQTDGYLYSIGTGEVPFLKQATFSIWRDLESMQNFAYKNQNHSEVIKKTRKQNWYSEELFARFEILKTEGIVSF